MDLEYSKLKQGMKIVHRLMKHSKPEIVIVACDTSDLLGYLYPEGNEEEASLYDGILYCRTEELYEQIKDDTVKNKYDDIERVDIDVLSHFMPISNKHAKSILEKFDN